MVRAVAFSALLIASTLIWSFMLLEAGIWRSDSALVGAVTMIILAAVSVVGMLVGHARWAKRLGVGLCLTELALASGLDISLPWWLGLAATAVSLSGMVGSGMNALVRQLPPAIGPPAEAVILPLLLLAAPGLLALARPEGLGLAVTVAIGCCWITALAYGKAFPGAVILTRLVIPATLLVSGLTADWNGLVDLLIAAVAVKVAWSTNAKVAIRPLVTHSRGVPIPPELTPSEIMEEAGYDSRGRIKKQTP